jgi:tRNA dimethylallyltransferase
MDKKIIVILGPTASGKSELAVKLAKNFNGEIISADSRQIYKGLDIGTGKVKKDKTKDKSGYYYKGIKHYLLSLASPKRRFTVSQYKKLALRAIEEIFKKGKIPIICGGTGFYIQAVVDGITMPEVPPDWQLRKKLEKKSPEELYQMLKKMDPKRARSIEKKNKRRLIRAIEIITKTKKPVPPVKKSPLSWPVLMIGIKKEKEELNNLIKNRFLRWIDEGLIKEVQKLKKTTHKGGYGLSWKKIEEFGIHYRIIAEYLQKLSKKNKNEKNYKEIVEKSIKEIQNYAKRQMTWFKKDKRIHWVKNEREAENLVKHFLKE